MSLRSNNPLLKVLKAIRNGEREISLTYAYDPLTTELISSYLKRARYKIVSISRSNGNIHIKALNTS